MRLSSGGLKDVQSIRSFSMEFHCSAWMDINQTLAMKLRSNKDHLNSSEFSQASI